MSGSVREDAGQMAVELAVLVPVIVAVALAVANVLQFAELVSRFDRVAPDAVVLHGVSASGVSSELAGVAEVKSAIEQAMGEMPCEVAVRAEPVSGDGSEARIDLAAGTTRFVCELGYRPWPSSVQIAGVGFELPVIVRHERSFVVDRFRAAVVS
ncbi:hypothetical protein [Parolsenella catena]|uniref:hypothetical protein n=1 Tax=Parolsenella catena TaxID=2003188 RepID=UPI001896A845|nr:hypothetical protein [Parolsenella catena]